MPLITLTTDFGTKDHYVGAVKGAIYGELTDVRIVDLSHHITPFSITEAAYVIKNAYTNFPSGTIHIIGVDAEVSPENVPIAIQLDHQYFICCDNGIISMILSEIKPEKIVQITIQKNYDILCDTLDLFVKVACHLARGGTLEVIGKQIDQIKQIKELQPSINAEQNQIMGSVIYIDNFGNAISNISKHIFESVGKGREFEIIAKRHTFQKIYSKYNDIVDFSLPIDKRQDDGKSLALFNSSKYLELSIYRSNKKTVGGASSLLGLDYRDNITVKFK
ncbi:MAG: SAM-dependent chlorinase/fluorinase [Lutimonas sp.]